MAIEESNYTKYRGKCKEFCEKEIEKDPSLTLVRGYFECPFWGRQQHWWCIKPNGEIVDPTIKQFPHNGIGGTYVEFDGNCTCEQCGKVMPEEATIFVGRYPVCSNRCGMRLVGL